MCVQKEERIRAEKKDFLHQVGGPNKRKFSGDFKSKKKIQFYPNSDKSGPKVHNAPKPHDAPAGAPNGGECHFCKQTGHFQKDCVGFLKWLAKRGNDTITFIDETLYADFSLNSWWIDSGATVHVTNSLQGFLTARTLRKGERSLRVADGKEAEVESVGSVSLVLDSGFLLRPIKKPKLNSS